MQRNWANTVAIAVPAAPRPKPATRTVSLTMLTTVATATLCYYMAPIILVLLSPLVFRERITVRKALCILAALLGMVFVSGAAGGGLPAAGELKGVLLALGAALLYALVVISNKRLQGLSAYTRTILQLLLSALTLLPEMRVGEP